MLTVVIGRQGSNEKAWLSVKNGRKPVWNTAIKTLAEDVANENISFKMRNPLG